MTTRAVVLARGLGRRLREADDEAVLDRDQQRAADAGDKPFMPVAGRPFLDFLLSGLGDAGLTRVGVVVAPAHQGFRRYYRETNAPRRVTVDFVVQEEARGTADAVRAAEAWAAEEPFLALNADNLYPAAALRRLAALDSPGLAVFAPDDLVRTGNIPPERVRAFALARVDPDGWLAGLIEKPSADQVAAAVAPSGISMNCWRFDARIFRFCREVPESPRGELELTGAVALAMRHGLRFKALRAEGPVLDLSRRADAPELSRRLAAVPVRP